MGIKISELESTSTANANDVFVINQNGKTKKITKQILQNQMKNLELEEEIEDLEKEVEILSETIDSELEDRVVTGESITVNDSARAKAKLDVGGNTDQKQYEGRNQFDKSANANVGNNLKTELNTGERISVGSATTAAVFSVWAVLDLTNHVGKTIRAKAKFKVSGNNKGRYYIGLGNSNGENRTSKVETNVSDTEIRFIVPELKENQNYLILALYGNYGGSASANDYIDYEDIMITINNEKLDFEPYVGGQASPNPDYPQEVQVVKGSNTIKVSNKNWIDLQDVTKEHAGIQVISNSQALTVKGTASATSFNTIFFKKPITLKANQPYILSANNEKTLGTTDASGNWASIRLQYGSTSISGTDAILGNKNAVKSFTVTEDTIVEKITVRVGSGLVLNDFVIKPQLEKGSTATYYAEHEEQNLPLTLPEGMEMCKIGDYKDGFIKNLDSGKWYKNEIIEKDVLNGNEVWNKNTSTGYEGVYYSPNKSFVANLGFCDIYSRFNKYNAHDYAFNTNGGAIVIKNKDIETVTDFKNALKNKNATTYFARINPQLIEITDETLISQLDKLYEVMTYYGQTNVTCEGDGLSPIFTLNYKKSNRLRLENIENRLAQIEQ